MQKVCEACRKPFETTNGRKKFCDAACRGRAHRGSVIELHVEPVDLHRDLPVSTATRDTLEAAGRLTTPAGAAALALAARIDADSDTGSALAAMVKEHRAALDAALVGAVVETDALDELRERRERKASAGS